MIYEGTLDELRRVKRELMELQAERAELDIQEIVLQEHQRNILQLLAQKART